MKKVLPLVGLMILVNISQAQKQPVDYVNTRIGNISHLLVPTFPTTHLPFGMLRMIPAHESFTTVKMDGLPLNVPSHRQGDVLLIKPFCGDETEKIGSLNYNYDHEKSTPYRYSVILDDYDIKVDFAPKYQSAVFEFDFLNTDCKNRYIALQATDSGAFKTDAQTISGYQNHNGIRHYFFLEFDKIPLQSEIINGKKVFAYARFKDEKVSARYGISYISVEQAKENLRKEFKNFDVTEAANEAKKIWNKELSKIKIEGGTENEKTAFYTALYRSSERMENISALTTIKFIMITEYHFGLMIGFGTHISLCIHYKLF